ncbi:HEAT repeat domain-containing protein [Desulfococcaceae bacterium HSG9]|nr:HEAT repeat domain-containing protein [Desulfococcaceae bacterium HSG9]
MQTGKQSIRKLKKTVFQILSQNDCERAVGEIVSIPLRRVVNPLFSFFYHSEEIVRWHAIAAMGAVTARLADKDIEAARVVMRRLIWNLNDESGGIGWGSPEALGEIMACSRDLAEEYNFLLVSYINPDGNFIEYDMLQRGVLWGLGRLAHTHPQLVRQAPPLLVPYLHSPDAIVRGLATWVAGAFEDAYELHPLIESLTADNTAIRLFADKKLIEISISRLAATALTSS